MSRHKQESSKGQKRRSAAYLAYLTMAPIRYETRENAVKRSNVVRKSFRETYSIGASQ